MREGPRAPARIHNRAFPARRAGPSDGLPAGAAGRACPSCTADATRLQN